MVFIFQPIYFLCATWKSKQTMEQQPHRACEWTKSKQKQNHVTSHSNWPRALLFNLAYKQCNGIIKRWLHCLTPYSKGRFFDNNILMFGSAWCQVMAQIQFSLIKKIKIGHPEHSLAPHSQHRIISHPLFPSLKVDVVCVSPLNSFSLIVLIDKFFTLN